MDDILIDGAQGEGGGQVLRTALGLSLVSGRPFRIDRIRARRARPGLLRQHLTAVQAAARVGQAAVAGAEIGSASLTFEPGEIRGGEYHFAVGTAGSATLVLQAILPALLAAPTASTVTLEGGTHNPAAPPFPFLDETLLPLLRRAGARIEARLERAGFHPAGGGRFVVSVEPGRLAPLSLHGRGPVELSARALVSGLPAHIATRELGVVRQRLALDRAACMAEQARGAPGPGNVLLIAVRSDEVTEIVTGFGEKGVTAEAVATRACEEVEAYLAAGVPVGRHLADQLLVPMALAGGGSFRTLAPTAHTTTNAAVIARFLPVDIRLTPEPGEGCRIDVAAA
jgi:RNA 3'-terminal phosphate cyclase (ATP)